MMKSIEIKGARIHNLKGINLSIPKNKFIVATGVSGSGKSSLMFDIVFEEGRRQYLQSLGVFSGVADENHFDSLSGIGPTIAVQQNTIRQSNPRSTVGSRSGLLTLLGLLYAADGQMACPDCDEQLNSAGICRACGGQTGRLDASYFSYNAPNGMCLHCAGRGASYEINLAKLVPDAALTLQQVFNSLGITPGYMRLFQRQFADWLATPFLQLPEDVRHEVIHGHYVENNYLKQSYCLNRVFNSRMLKMGEDPDGIYSMATCEECQGYRIGEEARSVLINGKHIGHLGKMSLTELNEFCRTLLLKNELSAFGRNLLNSVCAKLNMLIKLRLEHLSLYRAIPTLSGGEIQRLFLNNHLDSQMDSLIYVLDEPTVGLHESEKNELLDAMVALKELGNTVIVVEHDKSVISRAEHIIDIGPGAGIEGGELIYQGDLAGLLACRQSWTGQYLSGRSVMPPRTRLQTQAADAPRLIVRHSSTNNLKDVTVALPVGHLVGIAGVSGSGKSSLISKTLIPLLKRHFHEDARAMVMDQDDDDITQEAEGDTVKPVADRLEGVEFITGVAEVTQAPIGRNMNSNPATYIGIWDKIRKLFASQSQAKQRKLSAGHFSFNSKGACPACGGSGLIAVIPGGDLKMYRTCSVCRGRRYSEEALSVRYQGCNIADVLEMRISEALRFFEHCPDITPMLAVMDRIGMGYIGLGQPTPTLSGGEAQRIKLAKEIGRRRSKGKILYVLDEPTTGLSLYDTSRLIELLDELVTNGNTVVVIEHDITVLERCDWIVELGPGAGVQGGYVIAEGTPVDLKNNPASKTGHYLYAEARRQTP